jgi:hypothetical protein
MQPILVSMRSGKKEWNSDINVLKDIVESLLAFVVMTKCGP